MRSFWFGDMHGRHDVLIQLLKTAGVIDDDGNRTSDEFLVGSVGDLINLTQMDLANDEKIVQMSDKLVDIWLMGNHEAPLLFPHIGFQGMSPSPWLRTEVNRRIMSGKIVPCHVIGNTLITHAGVVKGFDFKTADDAADAIFDVWMRYSHYALVQAGGFTTYIGHFDFEKHGMPKAMLLDGVSHKRDGRAPDGGIFWADMDERKNKNFSQVFGHTPMKSGPVLAERKNGTFTLNIDSAVKKGLLPSGVWLDEDGTIIEIVTPKPAEDSFFSDDVEIEEIPAIKED